MKIQVLRMKSKLNQKNDEEIIVEADSDAEAIKLAEEYLKKYYNEVKKEN